jgi:GTP-binding protein
MPIVAIVGRPNVGKSTLFNRVIKKRLAIVDDQPGITRDRLYSEADWAGRRFLLVDTGGLIISEKDDLPTAIGDQARLAIDEADVILFMVDLEVGPSLEDQEIARMLLRSRKKTILVLNKSDSGTAQEHLPRFLSLGLGEGCAVSSTHGHGVGELLDQVVEHLPPAQAEDRSDDAIQVAVLGRPNVGKSSLVNAIVGEKRVIVDSTPGTTRDAVDTEFHMGRQRFVLIDTAGLRKKTKIKGNVEFYSSLRTLRSLQRCHVVLLVLDATQGPTAYDIRILKQVQDALKGVVMVLNKWDLMEGQEATLAEYQRQVYERYPSLSYVPMLGVSALTGYHVPRVLDMILSVYAERGRRVSTSQLNKFVSALVARKQPPSNSGRQTKIYYATQQAVHPPTFIFFTNNPEAITSPYLRYVRNRLRSAFGFQGAPLLIRIRKKKS